MVVDRVQQFIEDRRYVAIAIGVALMLGGGFLLTGVVELPAFQAMATSPLNDADMSVDRQTGIPIFKSVTPGTSTVEYEAEITNTGDQRAQFRLAVRPNNQADNADSFTASIVGEDQVTVSPGNTGPNAYSSYVTLDPSQSETWTVEVQLGDAQPGDDYAIAFWGEGGGGTQVTSIVNKHVTVDSAEGSIAVTLLGSTMMIGGFLLALVAV